MTANTQGSAERVVVGSYGNYAGAQRAVDYLSDQKFPVQYVTIVGSGLKLVETVTGRLDWGRAALAGAVGGFWFGLLIGLFVAIFSTGTSTLALVLYGALWGVIAGAIFGLITYAFTGGRRDFVSNQQLLADSYDVTVDPTHAESARDLLGRLRTAP